MERLNYQFRIDWSALKDRLVYLPGAAIMAYGLWLTLTV